MEKIKVSTFFVLGLIFVLLIQGAIPFLLAPTLGQAIWTMGFAQSFANDSFFSIYARNFGAPEPASIAFGLSGAWPASIFIHLGFRPVDAYTAMIASWLAVSFFFAFKLGKHFSLSSSMSVLGAIAWGTMPIIWAHAGYSMLSTGIALLPFYIFCSLCFFEIRNYKENWNGMTVAWRSLLYLFSCIVSVFMDGYTFVMFAAAGSFIGGSTLISNCKRWRYGSYFLFPIHGFVFLFSYFLYKKYMGNNDFKVEGLDFFRGWGVDLSFLVFPTKGTHWIMDFLNLGIQRSEKIFFGDASTWLTTFCIPIFIAATWAFFSLIKERKIKVWILLCWLCGFYMSLGPSLKINSQKPEGWSAHGMLEEHAVAPTGSSVFAKLPGFENMRASYRWLALGVAGAWLLTISSLSHGNRKYTLLGTGILGGVVLLNLPNLSNKIKSDIANRNDFLRIETEIVANLKEDLLLGAKVTYQPWRNDFLINYISAATGTISFNIGGDKNLAFARPYWPRNIRQFPSDFIDSGFADRVVRVLAKRESDFIIIPYVDMLKSAYQWPASLEFKADVLSLTEELRTYPVLNVVPRFYYVIVSLSREWAGRSEEDILHAADVLPHAIGQLRFRRLPRTQVGEVRNQWLVSTGKKGFLHFGPYIPVDDGVYKFHLYGIINKNKQAWVEITSSAGREIHFRFNLDRQPIENKSLLASEVIKLDGSIKDLEIRIFVGDEDDIAIQGYSLDLINLEQAKLDK